MTHRHLMGAALALRRWLRRLPAQRLTGHLRRLVVWQVDDEACVEREPVWQVLQRRAEAHVEVTVEGRHRRSGFAGCRRAAGAEPRALNGSWLEGGLRRGAPLSMLTRDGGSIK